MLSHRRCTLRTSFATLGSHLAPFALCITVLIRSAHAWQVQTEMMGDIHHFAWRALHRNQTVYLNKRDGERFGSWPAHLCTVSATALVSA